MSTAHTNFAAYSHQQLYAMLQAGDATSARTAAEKWKSTGIGLHEQAENLTDELADFSGSWTGGAADKYQTMITDLVGGIRKVAQTASDMNNLLEDAADALVKAKAEMPPPVAVPDVSPGDLSLAVNPPLLPADSSPATMIAAAQQRQQAIQNVDAQQQAAGVANAAHGKAIVVMTTLAGDYTSAEEAIPASPNAVTPKPVPPGGVVGGGGAPAGGTNGLVDPGVVVVTPGGGHPLPVDGSGLITPGPNGGGSTSSPLFGDMFTAGLAAASAAAFGRFGSIMPRVPPWASGKNPQDDKEEKPGTKLGGGAAGTGGSGGGIPIGGGAPPTGGGIPGGGGMGTGGPGDLPAAHSGLAGDGGAGNGLNGLAGGVAGAAGAAAAKSGMPMMPMMPMGGMGGGGEGSGRRIPAWLVETENVWGQSSPVAPSVIGEEQLP
ncbi:WXG100 family type VII secretion target [Amycolatopsis sp. H20-H5]|uniref:WXG100 family type VII secretion target n=1 Tax=Amycolatopsis sp. H20-H5 TaxID=3046309 RepID=UPI002DB9DA88|nr:WXG100 family type VII secretion target [Amycolatopsis sp. H20-H5]MEC3978340.1 WXG100 family type VII secretion target [Amycolatopsis sp. H20-H5]